MEAENQMPGHSLYNIRPNELKISQNCKDKKVLWNTFGSLNDFLKFGKPSSLKRILHFFSNYSFSWDRIENTRTINVCHLPLLSLEPK